MQLSDLQNKDVVDIKSGKKIGNIIDVTVDSNGNLVSMNIQKSKFLVNIFRSDEMEIKWHQIKKIGEDVILVDISL